MRSAARIKNHPIHPMLVAFPIALFTVGVAFDIFGAWNNRGELFFTARTLILIGAASGLVAGIFGAIDYFAVVPPKSSAKSRATKHMLVNIVVIALFLGAALLRLPNNVPSMTTWVLEVIGLTALTIGGWLGGTLVYRNQIGVDHRYANAGKWQEAIFAADGDEVEIGSTDDLEINQMKLLHIRGKRVALGRTETGYVAFDDRCTHKGGSLADGVMTCGVVACPWHGSQFDVQDGAVHAGPAKSPIACYAVRELNGRLLLSLVPKRNEELDRPPHLLPSHAH